MASPGHEYLPELARCLAVEASVFSWAETFRILSHDATGLSHHALKVLISSPKVKELLSQDVPAFGPPQPQSRNQFETRTAAINVTSPADKSYDINVIKANVSWLSEEVHLAEEEALRVVMLEWQHRSMQRLVVGYSDAEIASLRDALGDQEGDASQSLEQVFPSRNDDSFASADSVRSRLLDTYFQEQVGLLGVTRQIQELAMLEHEKGTSSNTMRDFARGLHGSTPTDAGVMSTIQAIESHLQDLQAEKHWSVHAEDTNDRWIATELHCVLILQELLLLKIRHAPDTTTADELLHWLQIMAGAEFFAGLQPGPLLLPSRVESLQAMSSIVTLAILDPATALGALSDPTSIDPTMYFFSSTVSPKVHEIILPVAESCLPQASPAALAWALILGELKHEGAASKEARESGAVQRAIDQGIATFDSATGRRTSSGSLQQSIYEDVIGAIMSESVVSDPATYLLRCTVEAAHVFETVGILAKERDYGSSLVHALALQVLQELLSAAVSSLGYTTDILAAQFAVLDTNLAFGIRLPNARETFIKNDFLMDNFFAVAAGRFPYESLPFLRLCRLLASATIFDDRGLQYITFRLKTMDSFTQSAAGAFSSYHTVREDENLNLVMLNDAVDILRGTQKRILAFGQKNTEADMIPIDTLGEVISESDPPVIRWQHSYSGLSLIGVWLELHYLGLLQSVLSQYENPAEVATECITIISALLQTTVTELPSEFDNDDRNRLQDDLLAETGSALQADSDIANCIFELLEQELQAYRRRPSNTFSTSVLVACIGFATVFARVRPNQFWSLFSKSSLLESYGSDSLLLSIVVGSEVPNQDYTFLQACTKLYEALIETISEQAQMSSQKLRPSRSFKAQPRSLRLHTESLMSLTQSLYSAFEASPSWGFPSKQQHSQIVTSLVKSFERIVVSYNAFEKSDSSLTSSLGRASDFLVLSTRSSSDDLSRTTSIIRHLFRTQEIYSFESIGLLNNQANSALQATLSFSNTLVMLGKLKSQVPSTLDLQLFSAIPLLCRSLDTTAERSALKLLRSLLDALAKLEPISLLGHLGSISSMSFLEVLKSKLGEWTDATLKVSIWDLLARLVGKNQQWLAIVILTGSPPDKARRDENSTNVNSLRGKTFMGIALKQLTKIVELDPAVATSILKFVIRAQMNWSWANEAVKSDQDFLPAVMSYVCNSYVDASDSLKVSCRNRIASLVTDLLTVHLHHAKAQRDNTTLRTVTPLLRWLTSNAIDASSYRHSLHVNLRKNFAAKFSGLDLNDFKRTRLSESDYGENYYYDLTHANIILSPDPQWERTDRFRDQSFSAEIRRANLNLSVVDSEVKMLNSFLNLCLEHSGYFTQDGEVQKLATDIVKHSLDANTQPYPSEKIFENVLQVRADISIALLQRLVEAKAVGPDARALLRHAWECARTNNGSFEQAITDNTLAYWRSMLTIVLFALQFHIDRKYMPPAADSSPAALLHHTDQAIPTILELVTIVIGQGFRSVAASLQDRNQAGAADGGSSTAVVSHKDLYLILTIFEAILRMTRLPEFISEASQRLIVEGTIQSCLMLFSWSHALTGSDFDNEPIYASYCLRFLTSLSSLPLVTEELAVEGVLSRLLSSRITQKLQAVPEGAAHLDKRPHVQTLYNLWATGFLPICVNLLHSVGAPVAAEVSVFLNQFAKQLSLASVAFISSQSRSADGNAITSTVASEAATLALISYILDSLRNAGASAAVDPSTVRSLSGYDEHRKALAEDISDLVGLSVTNLKTRIVPVSEKELTLTRHGNGEGLVKKVIVELKNALTCLKSEEVGDETPV